MPPTEGSPLRLLIDACLTPAMIPHFEVAFGSRVDAVHVDAVLAAGAPDQAVFDWAARTGRIVVTANIGDFIDIARRTKGHLGLVLVEDQNTRNVQIASTSRIIAAVLAWTTEYGDPAGHVFTWRRTGGGRLAARKLPQ